MTIPASPGPTAGLGERRKLLLLLLLLLHPLQSGRNLLHHH